MTVVSSTAGPLSPKLNLQLSVMMFLQYAIWGAWLPLFFSFAYEHRHIEIQDVGILFSLGAVGALAAPFISGQIADRYFNTEKFLGISHIVGAVMVWQLAKIESYSGLVIFGILYSMIYAPTLALTNSLAFHHLPDRDRDFGRVRVWGTVGWIVVGIGMGQWLLHTHTPPSEKADTEARAQIVRMIEDSKPLTAARAEAAKAYAQLKPEEALLKSLVDKVSTEIGKPGAPAEAEAAQRVARMTALETSTAAATKAFPDLKAEDALQKFQAGKVVRRFHVAGMADSFKLSAILGVILGIYCFMLPKTPPKQGQKKFAPWEALSEVKKMPLLALFLISFPVSCIHQFYFVHTAGFLGNIKTTLADKINHIFGVGGGGLMTIGQIAELAVLAFMPLVAKKASRKMLLGVGLVAYILRFAVFAYSDNMLLIGPALALHGLCFGCFFFVAFMIVDEETPADVRASAQGLYNFVVIGLGTIIGNLFAGYVGKMASASGTLSYKTLFTIPMVVGIVCLVALLALYRGGKKAAAVA
jgi:MFS family permease